MSNMARTKCDECGIDVIISEDLLLEATFLLCPGCAGGKVSIAYSVAADNAYGDFGALEYDGQEDNIF